MAGFKVKRVGYFGKMPKAGDFVSRNVDAPVKDGFDRWLQASISESRAQMKDSWTSAFLTAPIWRFLLHKQFNDSKSVLGVMIPSVDKVGRYFPLAVLIELSNLELDRNTLAAADKMLNEFEDLLMGALSEEFDQDYFDYQVGVAARKYVDKPAPTFDDGASGFQGFDAAAQDGALLRNHEGSIWWTEGSDHRQADLLLYPGMPASAAFASFLRDPSHFRELEMAWDVARDLGPSQTDNPPVDFPDAAPSVAFHLISHAGRSELPNTSATVYSGQSQSLFVSDGRFGTGYFAMASRLLGKVIPPSLTSEALSEQTKSKPENGDGELEKIEAFLSAKFPNTPRSILGTPFSFACAYLDNPHAIRLIVAGNYLCLHKSRSGVRRVFDALHVSEDATIRQDEAGFCKSVVLQAQTGDRLLICSPLFDTPYLTGDIYEALAARTIGEVAKSAWQNATIKGLSGNVALAAIEITAAPPAASELQPQLGVE
jgi:type VI secretion system protein ImpM